MSPVFTKTIYLGEDGVLSAEFTDGYVGFAQERRRMEEVVRVLPPQMPHGWREGGRGELGRILVGPSHIKHCD